MVPEQGPFHVTLNVQQGIMQIYHFVLFQVYRETFGSELPHKPKPFTIKCHFLRMATTENQNPSEIPAVQRH